jgi:hypothetical protein
MARAASADFLVRLAAWQTELRLDAACLDDVFASA